MALKLLKLPVEHHQAFNLDIMIDEPLIDITIYQTKEWLLQKAL